MSLRYVNYFYLFLLRHKYISIIYLGLVDVLKDEIKYIHAFVIAFKQTDNRMTASLRSMIGLFQKMFGDHFWKNAVLGKLSILDYTYILILLRLAQS